MFNDIDRLPEDLRRHGLDVRAGQDQSRVVPCGLACPPFLLTPLEAAARKGSLPEGLRQAAGIWREAAGSGWQAASSCRQAALNPEKL